MTIIVAASLTFHPNDATVAKPSRHAEKPNLAALDDVTVTSLPDMAAWHRRLDYNP